MNLEYKSQYLEKAILQTIAFFDMFDYPLTAFEVWKYLGVRCETGEVVEFLNSPFCHSRAGGNLCERSNVSKIQIPDQVRDDVNRERGELQRRNGFYFLKGREGIIETRLRRYNYTDEKIKRAIWVSRIFKFIPWIKGIAIGNIIGSHNLKKDGDIDFFIITQKDRIWITRFYCILITKVLGLRPKHGKIKDKICLSFFVSEKRLNLKDLMLENQGIEFPIGNSIPESGDIYFIHWLAGLVPIYDSENIFNKFFKENNWLKEYLPNWQSGQAHFKRKIQEKSFCKIFSFLGAVGDGVLKFLQIKMMNEKLKELMNKDTRVVVNDQILKLHANDRREEYKDKFLNYNF